MFAKMAAQDGYVTVLELLWSDQYVNTVSTTTAKKILAINNNNLKKKKDLCDGSGFKW